MKFRTRDRQIVTEFRHRVRAEMHLQLRQLIEFAETNEPERVEQVWCKGCNVYHDRIRRP